VTGNTARIISSVENKFKTEVMTISLSPLFQIQERDRRRRIWERQQESSSDSESGQDGGFGHGRSGEKVGEESDDDDDTWKSTVWIQMPGPSEMATGTETKGIVKTHTVQLILLCGMIPPPQGSAATVEMPAIANAPSSASTVSLSTSGNREFRLESK